MTKTETKAIEVVEFLKNEGSKMTTWISAYTTIGVGRSYSSGVTKTLKKWKVLIVQEMSGAGTPIYQINRDAEVFQAAENQTLQMS